MYLLQLVILSIIDLIK